jgi:hypothetical protein
MRENEVFSLTQLSCLILQVETHIRSFLLNYNIGKWESDYWTHLILFWLLTCQCCNSWLSDSVISIRASHLILQVFCSFNSIHFNHLLKTAFISAIKIQLFVWHNSCMIYYNSNHFFLKVWLIELQSSLLNWFSSKYLTTLFDSHT